MVSQSTPECHGSTKMGEKNRFSFAETSFGTLHSDLNELSGFSVGETSVCLWGQLWGQLVNHSATRGQVSIGLAGN